MFGSTELEMTHNWAQHEYIDLLSIEKKRSNGSRNRWRFSELIIDSYFAPYVNKFDILGFIFSGEGIFNTF